MKRFIEGESRSQSTLLPECLDDYITEDNPVRAVEAFIEELDLLALGFAGMEPAATGRPSLSPFDSVEALSVWVSEPHTIQSAAGARVPAQHRTDVADWQACAGLQDYRGLPSGQW